MKVDQKNTYIDVFGKQMPHMDYEEYGVKGVGKFRYPMVNMDKYIDHSMDDELHQECCIGLAQAEDYKMGMIYGAIPPEEAERLNCNQSWSQILKEVEKYDPTGVHRKCLKQIVETTSPDLLFSAIYKYAYFAMDAAIPWFFALYLKRADFWKKTEDVGVWTKSADLFPKLRKYLDTLPFKTIGRVLFFTTYPNAGVTIHRDANVVEHSDHNINLFFSAGSRPSFVWDEIKKEKIYLDSSARSYFFNNRDYHGVDPEPRFRYTVRVDGTFTDELCEELGLVDGKTWSWNYE